MAVGDGCGVCVVAETDTGCRLGEGGAACPPPRAPCHTALTYALALHQPAASASTAAAPQRPPSRPVTRGRAGAAVPGERNCTPEDLGERCGEELAEALMSGACVDQWCGGRAEGVKGLRV
jgi:hypothetical protein